jgi:hypothetical protein
MTKKKGMRHGHGGDSPLVPVSSTFISDLPFTKRWTAGLQQVFDEGGWCVQSAGAQQGKSVANRAFLRAHEPSKRPDGTYDVPVAATVACPQQALLLHDLAASLGVGALLRRGNIIEVIAAGLIRGRTRLIMINNGHEMDWRQWEKLLALHEVYLRRGGIAPGIVFSSIGEQVGLPSLPSMDEALDQLRKRLFYRPISGHSKSEVAAALRLFLERRVPDMLTATTVITYAPLLWQELTSEFFDTQKTKRVAAVDIDETVLRMEALFAGGECSGEQLVRQAIALYRIDRSRADEAAA